MLDAIGQFLDDAFMTNSLGRLAVSNLIVLLRVTQGTGFEEIQKHLKHDFLQTGALVLAVALGLKAISDTEFELEEESF